MGGAGTGVFVNYQSVSPDHDVLMCVYAAGPLGDRARLKPSSPGGGALHGDGGDRGGGAEQRQTHHQPLHRGESLVQTSLLKNI